ncbi:Dehydrogenase RED2 [Fusarium oxysporum f. sp. albedinis]|nr:Dehydrogenase RED2 [Fusarium oxysporum f. sp. albedinis]
MACVIKLHATGMPVMVVFFVTGFYHVHNMTMANQPLVIDRYVIKMKEAIRPGNSFGLASTVVHKIRQKTQGKSLK